MQRGHLYDPVSFTASSARQDWHSTWSVSPAATVVDGATGAAWTGAGGGVAMCRDVEGAGGGGVGTTGLFRTTVWSLGLAPPDSDACRCFSASSRVLKIRKNALRPSMSKTTLTLGCTLTREMPPLSGVTESDRLMR